MNSLKKAYGALAALALGLAGAALFAAPAPASAQSLTGAGSTFVNPIMSRWIFDYDKANGTQINYQAIGSGGGINALINHTVDFAGSDVPMSGDERGQAKAPVVHIPDIIGAVVVAYNVPGIGPGVHLSPAVIAGIYEGKITSWGDPQIAKLNPNLHFPSKDITVTHRSDGSGTTAIFTDYLSKISPTWKSGPGTGKSIDWPVGVGGKGNAGVAGILKARPYSIGYVELAYAVQNVIYYAAVQNSHGVFVYPTVEAAAAAAQGVKLGSDLTASLTDTPNPKGYPITGYSYVIAYKASRQGPAVKKFLSYVVTTGQDSPGVKDLYYARIPASVAAQAEQAIAGMK